MAEKYFQQPSVMTSQQHFSQVPKADIQRSRFDRSHAHKTTFNAGDLVPVYVDEVLPGDSFTMNSTAFVRLATPLKPIMDNIYLDVQYFFVPYRLVWEHWQEFMGERKNPDDDPSIYSVPTLGIGRNSDNDRAAWRYFGIPHDPAATVQTLVSALPFRAYWTIWNEWYRDQNLQERMAFEIGDNGVPSSPTNPDGLNFFELAPRGKRHDYFTSCLPWPQKGDPVFVPIGDTAPLVVIGDGAPRFTFNGATEVSRSALSAPVTSNGAGLWAPASMYQNVNTATPNAHANLIWDQPNLEADLSAATSISINELRTAFQIQKLLERDARGGTRYIELILAHFGVRSPDGRLQRPEYLGGGTTRVNINPVAATATDPTIPQGSLAATGTGVSRAGFNKSFTEHGIIIGLASARADLTYQKGIERFWSRQTRYDFYWPSLAHLGEQAVLNKEIWAAPDGSTDDDVFGYQERYAEYRYKPSLITGKFASNDAESLDVWHLSQDFNALPTLGHGFIQENPPIGRIVAVPSEPDFLADFWFDLKCDRPMPVYSVPGFIDHF